MDSLRHVASFHVDFLFLFFFFNISTFSLLFLSSTNNKNRAHWWVWFSWECRAVYAFKALLRPAQADVHHACCWTWPLPGWWLPSLPAPPCCHATVVSQLKPHPARSVPCCIQQMPPQQPNSCHTTRHRSAPHSGDPLLSKPSVPDIARSQLFPSGAPLPGQPGLPWLPAFRLCQQQFLVLPSVSPFHSWRASGDTIFSSVQPQPGRGFRQLSPGCRKSAQSASWRRHSAFNGHYHQARAPGTGSDVSRWWWVTAKLPILTNWKC